MVPQTPGELGRGVAPLVHEHPELRPPAAPLGGDDALAQVPVAVREVGPARELAGREHVQRMPQLGRVVLHRGSRQLDHVGHRVGECLRRLRPLRLGVLRGVHLVHHERGDSREQEVRGQRRQEIPRRQVHRLSVGFGHLDVALVEHVHGEPRREPVDLRLPAVQDTSRCDHDSREHALAVRVTVGEGHDRLQRLAEAHVVADEGAVAGGHDEGDAELLVLPGDLALRERRVHGHRTRPRANVGVGDLGEVRRLREHREVGPFLLRRVEADRHAESQRRG